MSTDPVAVFDIVSLDDLPAYLFDNGLTVTALRWQGSRLVAEVKEVEANNASNDTRAP